MSSRANRSIKASSSKSRGVTGAANSSHLREQAETIATHLLVFLIAFVIVLSRRPDSLFNAQFWAEDGTVWYSDAYNFGLRCLLMPYGSYFTNLTRLMALLAQLFPFSLAPLVMNLSAITVKILPVNVLLSSRFSQIPLRIRLLASFVYLALPNSFELHSTITAIQWHLAFLACLLLLAQETSSWGWRVFTGIVLVLTSLNGPEVFVLVPLAAAVWWKERQDWNRANFALLIPGALIQAMAVLSSWYTRQTAPIGAGFGRLIAILGRQVFLPSLLGLNMARLVGNDGVTFTDALAAGVGLALLLYTLCRAPFVLKLFVVFAYAVLALCLARPLAGTPDQPQWVWMCIPGVGNRYYFLPMLAFLASLLWIATDKRAGPRALRYFAVMLLLLLPVGIYEDWQHPPFVDYHFQQYAAKFEHDAPGTTMTIPINPAWKMTLTKR